MKSMLRYGLLGFGVYLIFLVALMPAEFVLKHVPMQNTVQLSGVQGSIWKGHVAKAQIYGQTFDNLTWNVSLLNILLLTPKVNIDNLKNDNVQAKGNLGYSVWSSAIYADNITAKIDAAWLKRQLPVNAPVGVQGTFALNLQEISWQDNWVQHVQGDLLWHNASINSPVGLLELATPKVVINSKDNQVILDVNVNSEALALNSQTKLSKNGRYELKGTLEPKTGFPEKMQSALAFVGSPNEAGVFELNHKGQIF